MLPNKISHNEKKNAQRQQTFPQHALRLLDHAQLQQLILWPALEKTETLITMSCSKTLNGTQSSRN
jgi:hypothetical protein